MSSDFITEITPWWGKHRFLSHQSLAICRMIPLRMHDDEVLTTIDPDVKEQIEAEQKEVILEEIDVNNTIADIVVQHRGWLEGRCFELKHEKRWKFDQRELCKVISVTDKGRARILKAWKGYPAWTDEEVFSVYAGGAHDFHSPMIECDESEFANLIKDIRSFLPTMIPESRHVNTTKECYTIVGLISESMGVLDFKNLQPTFDLMNKADQFMVDNIDKFAGRCYVDTQSGTSYAITGLGWDKLFKKNHVKAIVVDEPSIDNFFCDTPTRLMDVGTFKISPFTRVRQTTREVFLENAFSILDGETVSAFEINKE